MNNSDGLQLEWRFITLLRCEDSVYYYDGFITVFCSGAAGNLATEVLLGLLHEKEIETGIDRAKVAEASRRTLTH
jgi:hypothetical protein